VPLAELAAFLGVSVVVIVTPGQDTLLNVRNTLLGGRRRGVATALGVATGQAVWTVATSAGLAGLLLASKPAFLALRVVAIGYLAWLGLQALRDAIRPAPKEIGAGEPAPGRQLSGLAAYRQGAVSNLSNPKMAIFFVSLLPQFAAPGRGAFVTMLSLGLVFCLMTLTWLVLSATVVARMGALLRRSGIRRVLDGVTACAFVGLGARLAATLR